MSNKNYLKGYNFEKRVKKYLESLGYYVLRQGKSAFPDLIAIKKAEKDNCAVYAIECKVKRKYLSVDERNRLVKMWYNFNLSPYLAYREGKKLFFMGLINSHIYSAGKKGLNLESFGK